jgi:pilus assembly protein CpaC
VSFDSSILSRRSLIALGLAAGVGMAQPASAQAVAGDKASSSIPASFSAAAAAAPGTIGHDLAAATSTPAQDASTQKAAAAVNIRPILIPRPIDTDHAGEVGGSFSSEGMNVQTTHITVGRSIFVDSRHRVARVYITNPDVVDSYTASPNQIVVTAKKAGASTLIMWDETGESKSYLISSDLNVDMLRESLKQALPNQNIKAIGNETRVVLTGTVDSRAVADAAVKIAGIYSKEVSDAMLVNSAGIKQVRLEVKIVEVDRTKLAQFGFNFFGTGGQNPASTTTGMYPSTMGTSVANGVKTLTTTNPLNFSIYLNRFNIGATLQDLETMQLAQILAEPNITTLSGEKADFLAGGEFPFPIVQSSTTGAPVITLVFKPYGVKLAFTPIVNNDGTIELTVAPEVSALDYTNAVTISGYTIPAISTRRAETQVVLKSGQTFAISGLIDKRTTDLYAKTPGAASIPILGQLFKSKNVTHSDNELLVIVTPIIVDPLAEPLPKPPAPDLAIPFLDKQKYDNELPKGAKKP